MCVCMNVSHAFPSKQYYLCPLELSSLVVPQGRATTALFGQAVAWVKDPEIVHDFKR